MTKKPNNEDSNDNPLGQPLPVIIIDEFSGVVRALQISFEPPNFNSIVQIMKKGSRPE